MVRKEPYLGRLQDQDGDRYHHLHDQDVGGEGVLEHVHVHDHVPDLVQVQGGHFGYYWSQGGHSSDYENEVVGFAVGAD